MNCVRSKSCIDRPKRDSKVTRALSSLSRKGFTLVELLVVIAIIGILVALLLPAVQAAREAARRNQCKNHLKQLALGCLLHEDTHKFLPSGGWIDFYTADANMGYGERQPGSWLYSVLPYIEETAVHDLNKGLSVNPPAAGAQAATTSLNSTPITIFHCPSRRVAKLYPVLKEDGSAQWNTLKLQTWVQTLPGGIVKSDYAANTGDSFLGAGNDLNGKKFVAPAVSDYPALTATVWSDTNKVGTALVPNEFRQTGVIHYHSEISGKRITDGTSNTYLIGEKFLAPRIYEIAEFSWFGYGDNQGAYVGFEYDNQRRAWNFTTTLPNNTRPNGASDETDFQPRQDVDGTDKPNVFAFGSAHAGAMSMAMCDGSIQSLSYDIDPLVHHYLAVRNDAQVAELPQ